MNCITSELDGSDLGRSAIVFAPHPDDETLGCGGTIIKKKGAGAEVKIVFMTDGSHSNRLIPASELKFIRSSEALAATRLLGVEENNIIFLDFEDGRWSEEAESASDRLTEVLTKQRSEEIFIPYFKDPHPDHLATNKIVISALRRHKRKAIIYEYPIWYWRHWPWTTVPMRGRRTVLRAMKNSFISGMSLLRDFRYSVYIGDVLELKHDALDQYRSQLTRLVPNPRWVTLGDIGNGEFLECFFQRYEIFYHHNLYEK